MRAVADGVVWYFNTNFWHGTGEIAVVHKDFLSRYCEIDPTFVLNRHQQVKHGEIIGRVGQMKNEKGENVKQNMLHFEIYSGKEGKPLTDKSPTGGPCMRRSDLLDPTSFLDNAKME